MSREPNRSAFRLVPPGARLPPLEPEPKDYAFGGFDARPEPDAGGPCIVCALLICLTIAAGVIALFIGWPR